MVVAPAISGTAILERHDGGSGSELVGRIGARRVRAKRGLMGVIRRYLGESVATSRLGYSLKARRPVGAQRVRRHGPIVRPMQSTSSRPANDATRFTNSFRARITCRVDGWRVTPFGSNPPYELQFDRMEI